MSPSTIGPATALDLLPASKAPGGRPRNNLAVLLSMRLLGAFLFLTSLIFVSAWTLLYWQAALYLLCVFIPVTVVSTALLARNPAVIERRLTTAERSRTQQALIRAFRPLFVLILFVPGLDHRFGISSTITGPVPVPVALICDGVIVLALLFAGWVLHVNEFAGRSIRVEQDQPLIATGPYCVVRHPLYSASLILWLATPLALGSWIAVPLFALLIPFYILRLMNEEMVLSRELKGYAVYCKRTPFRLIPFVW